jgi:hypothetical protein
VLPNLAFAKLFFLLLNQTLLKDVNNHVGIPDEFGAFGPEFDLTATGNPL